MQHAKMFAGSTAYLHKDLKRPCTGEKSHSSIIFFRWFGSPLFTWQKGVCVTIIWVDFCVTQTLHIFSYVIHLCKWIQPELVFFLVHILRWLNHLITQRHHRLWPWWCITVGWGRRKARNKTWFVGSMVKDVVGLRCLHQKWPFVLQDTVHWIIADELVTAASQQQRFIQSQPMSASPKVRVKLQI